MIDQLREGDFAKRQNPAYELLCRDAGEAQASPAFFLLSDLVDLVPNTRE